MSISCLKIYGILFCKFLRSRILAVSLHDLGDFPFICAGRIGKKKQSLIFC